jgi:hypothetical protein
MLRGHGYHVVLYTLHSGCSFRQQEVQQRALVRCGLKADNTPSSTVAAVEKLHTQPTKLSTVMAGIHI